MQFYPKRTVLAYLWFLITNVYCLPGMLKQNREIASKISCQISQQVDELLQINQVFDNQFGILRTIDGFSLTFSNLNNSFLENQVIVTVNKNRDVQYNNYLQYQDYGFEQNIIQGLNYIYTRTTFSSPMKEGIMVHILSIYQQGQVKQQIYETSSGLQYNFRLNEQQDYFVQIIFATAINNNFKGSEKEIESIMKTINMGLECKPNTCQNDKQFIDLIKNLDLHQQIPKLITQAQYRTNQSIYNYDLINDIYVSSIENKEIIRYISFTDECIQIMSKQDEINNIQIDFQQYFCVASLIQSIKFSSTQHSQKQFTYLILLQQSPDSDSQYLIDQLLQLVSSLKCMNQKYDKLIQSSSLFLQPIQITNSQIQTNSVEVRQNTFEVETISFDLQQPIKSETENVIDKQFSDDIFDQPKQVEEQQHEQRLNEVEHQLAKTQEMIEPIRFDQAENSDSEITIPVSTTEQIVFDEYNSQNLDSITNSSQNNNNNNREQQPIIQQEQGKPEVTKPQVETYKVNENHSSPKEQLTKSSNNQPDQSNNHNHNHYHHFHHHHHSHQHHQHYEQVDDDYDQNSQKKEPRNTNLRGKRNHENENPIITDKIVVEYNFVHQQPLKKGNLNSEKNKKKETEAQVEEEQMDEENIDNEQEPKEENQPKKKCKPKNQEQEISNEEEAKEEDLEVSSNDNKPKCQKKKKNNGQDKQEEIDEEKPEDENENNKQNIEEEQDALQNDQRDENEEQPKRKKCKKNKDKEIDTDENVQVEQANVYDVDANIVYEQFCKQEKQRQESYMRQKYDNSNGLEDELYWRYKHMKRQQIPYPFNGYPYKHRKQSTDHSPFPHVNSYYKKHPFSIPSSNQAPWVGRDFFPDTGYGMSRVMDAYKGRYADPEQVLKDLAVKNKQQKQWREQVQRYREQIGYGDEYQYFDQNYYDQVSPNDFQPFNQPEEQVYDYLNDSQYRFRQGKKPLEKPNRDSIVKRDIQRQYEDSDCFVVYDQCHYQGRRLQLCGEYPDIPYNIQGFKIFSYIIPDNLELRFFESSDYENNIKDVEGNEECLEVPYELIPQQ